MASAKPSIEQLKDMSNDEYTKLLARNMADTLNAKTKSFAVKSQPNTGKGK
jgi:hypothetical protein